MDFNKNEGRIPIDQAGKIQPLISIEKT